MRARHLILFDIDGTLLRCGRQVRPLFLDALREVFGVTAELDAAARGYDFSGRTDPEIVLDLLALHGLPRHEVAPRLPAMREAYARRLEAGLRREEMRLLPGVFELLDRLAARRDLAVGLLTGNWRRCAEVKLSRFELWSRFAFGAFGDDAVARRDLVPIALERAARFAGRRFSAAETTVVGDSIRDVDCAHAAGAACVAVATGFTTPESLLAAGAERVFSDLQEAARDVPVFATA